MQTSQSSIKDSTSSSTFHDLDDPRTLDECLDDIQSGTTRNFIADFSDDGARAVFDVSITSFCSLLEEGRPDSSSTRWINVWCPFQQRAYLEILARRYDFTPRLLALMCSDPKQRRRSRMQHHQSHHSHHWTWKRQRKLTTQATIELALDELSEQSSISSTTSVGQSNIYSILKDIWHYTSMDFGRSYVCAGYNTLYGTKNTGHEEGHGPLPHCTRIWTWLIICEDKTVISINEDPFPDSDGELSPLQKRIVAETRRNLKNVFRSLSVVDEALLMVRNPLTVLPIRTRVGNTREESAHRPSDAPGLLFYYLFENWQNSYTLVTRKESRYGVELNELRHQMFEKPQLCHIDRLDYIGKELGVLRRHYESYNRIIDRLLEPIGPTNASLTNSRIVEEDASQTSLDTVRPIVAENQSMLGVSLSAAARVRFKRLRDLIDLYALSEVEEYLKQKDSLITMNFNLIAIKQSTDVDRLTRVTLLLTKATILFLPVSFMTNYFAVELQGTEYTVMVYWVTFAIVFSLSWIALFVFGVLSGSMQMTEVWRSIRRVLTSVSGRR